MDVPGIVVPKAEDPVPALFSGQPQSRTSQPGSGLQGEDEVAETAESGACVPNHEGTIGGDDDNGSKGSQVADLPVIATAVQ